MDPNNNSKTTYYINAVLRKIQTFFITTPEASYLLLIGVAIIVIFILAKLFVHLP